jgi:hypothetical protein
MNFDVRVDRDSLEVGYSDFDRVKWVIEDRRDNLAFELFSRFGDQPSTEGFARKWIGVRSRD